MQKLSSFKTIVLFQLCVHLGFHQSWFSFGHTTRCKTTERESLVRFKRSLHDPGNRLSSWVGERCCDWVGVGCDNITGNVRHLDLQDAGLSAPNLDPNLVNLTNLRYLNLWRNNFKESTIPEFIGSMKHLRYLDLSGASFGGVLPTQLGNLTSLVYLDLSYNSFNGLVMGIMGKLCKLKYLDLSNNNIQGEMGEIYPHCIADSLKYLFLDSNGITGTLPISIAELKQLTLLFLSDNKFHGQIPYSIGDMSLLEALEIRNNNFSGTIPTSIGRLSSLEWLDMSSNNLQGTISKSHFANLSSLESLGLSSNLLDLDFTSGWIPPFQLGEFVMSNCIIHGPFPQWIQTQSELVILDLSNNFLSGPFTDNSTNATWLCELKNLTYLFLENNNLTGTIPNNCWQNSTSLSFINLSNNALEGEISAALFARSESLVILDLGGNMLTGRVPSFTATNLTILRLQDNRLGGVIPRQLCTLHRLQVLDLGNNNLTGSIPNCFGQLYDMSSKPEANDLVALPRNENIKEVLKSEILSYTNEMYLVNLDLSCNGLVGSIPEELSNLSALIGLNLSYNHLTGEIPEKTGQMRSLESLDLSNNNIYGTIPAGISTLNFLSHLNLSHNKLQGEIPTGHQLQTLNDPSIYASNRGLCGDPLPNKCIRDDHQEEGHGAQREQEDENRSDKLVFCVVIFLGLLTGFWGVIGTLLLKNQWRHSLFEKVEDWMD